MSIPIDEPLSQDANRQLENAEAHARDRAPRFLSLAPDRTVPTPLIRVVHHVTTGDERHRWGDQLAAGIAYVTIAQSINFPENIFWDADFLIACLARGARTSTDPDKYLRATCNRIAALQNLFGPRTAIRFRYAHDFMYGFDWAKWVRRNPHERTDVGPFDAEFLAYTEGRGRELLDLIDHDDRKYPKLGGNAARNPFPFSREPDDEQRLFEQLATKRMLPIEGWRTDATPDWRRPYDELRTQVANELGTSTHSGREPEPECEPEPA